MRLLPGRRTLLRAGLLLAGVGLVTALAVLVLVATSGGTRWALGQAAGRVPGTLVHGRVEGTLLGWVAIHDLRFEDDRMRLRVARLALDWEPGRLWSGEVAVRSVRADGVRLELRAPADGTPARPPPDSLPAFDVPLALVVGEVSVRDLTLRASGESDTSGTLQVDSLRLTGIEYRDTLTVAEFALRAPLADLTGKGRVVPRGDYPLEIGLHWLARLPDLPPHSGHGVLTGSVADLVVRQELAEPFRASFEARIHDLPDPPRYEAHVDFESLRVRDYGAGLPAAHATGRIEIAGDSRAVAGTGSARVASTEHGVFATSFRLAGEGTAWRLEELLVRVPGRPTRLRLSGGLDMAGKEPVFHVTGDGRDLVWPLTGPSQVAVRTVAITAAGRVDGYDVDVRAHVSGPAVPAGRWRVSGRGDVGGFDAGVVEGQTVGGRIAGRGMVRWTEDPAWRAAFSATGLDPGQLWPEWTGTVAFDATSDGRIESGGPRGWVSLQRLDGSLRGRALRGHAALSFAGDTVQVDTLEVVLGGAELTVGGSLGAAGGVAFHLAVPDAGTVWPGVAGALDVRGRVSGSPEAPHVVLAAHAESLAFANTFIDSARASGDLDLAPSGPLELDVVARGILAGGSAVDSLHLASTGDHATHAVTLTAAGGAQRFALGLSGSLGGPLGAPTWRGQIQRLDLDTPTAGRWTLAAPSSLLVDRDGVALGELEWRSGASRLTVERASASRAAWHVAARADSVALARLEPFLPRGVAVGGALSGRAEAHGSPGAPPFIEAELRTTPGELAYPTPRGTQRLALGLGSGTVATADSGLTAGFRLPLAARDSLVLQVDLARWMSAGPPKEQPIRGRVEVRLTDLGFVQAFAPELEDVGGRLDGLLDVGGTLARPTVTGRLALTDAGAALPRLGLKLVDGALAIEGRADGTLVYEGGITSGSGTLHVAGEGALPADRPAHGRLTLAGQRIQVLATDEQQLVVSPDLAVEMAPGSLSVVGTVTVPEGHLQFEDLTSRATVPVSPDVVIAGEADSVGSAPVVPVHADVELVLEDGFSVEGYGLKGSPRGRLRLLERPGSPTRASGELNLADGRYSVYGQEFEVERGRLVYSGGSLLDPGLEVRVSRRTPDGVLAGFEIGGTLERPSLEVFSEPVLSEQEALSYALLGRPLGQAGGGQADLLRQAATKLGLGGGNFLARSIANRFGLAQAHIESKGPVKDASLILGAYLSPRLYVNYGVGLFEPVSTLRVRYLLSRWWTVEAQSAEENSADLLYTIER